MSNTFAPFGFSQHRGTGSAPTYEQTPRSIALTAGAIYAGDPVTSQADGTIAQSVAGTTQIAGIFVGCEYVSATLNRKVWSPYWPGSGSALANTTVTGYVINDPNAQFLCQSGNAGSPVAATDVGANINFAIGTGNALNGLSGAYANQATIATTATLPFRIVAVVTAPPGSNGTDSASNGNWIVVAFNNVDTKSLTGIV
ncbi:hypothetical protein EOA60_20780 [Mesorhizobium sp. M1A.F.Ca.IN.020.06.1.1]|uniref:hypothetical protein n=1 Tax=unclassified Mesorhizobium TaxID=325217 RepID=UPI000FCBC91D|nr:MULTISPECIES: hypothetical protein [unclassified Mesorhizobium]RUV86934.1 hypothetical protein EOA51_13140 [Mesorhizobium sp. M1A.F.Ca.IN.020.32.1.1]RUW10570.1 hypothetical protein EOA46_14915 [Mesorhizobium sp. M1A.F.Ca.IN.022.05.2.1]RUW24442.1 hypothetical protein EOA60_20780 [Mesorhizobium sp. M1A.F.Ca.IN.020.06.1.1]RWF81651.1 MAG: hypothetical protein EOQ35_13245 [Mesorhizobium sp.]RWG03002.1 MAG: hypothetical protein EOQ38_09265 [Mesorhizobium sp.]